MNKETQRFNVTKNNSATINLDSSIVYSHLGVKTADIHKCHLHEVNCNYSFLVEINSVISLLNEFKSNGSKFIDFYDEGNNLIIEGYNILAETEIERTNRIRKQLKSIEEHKAIMEKHKISEAKALLENNGFKITKK